jgi:hypothetical protein
LKLAGLFAGTFLAVFLGLFFVDLLRTLREGKEIDSATANQPASTAIDPKLETELAKVLEPIDSQTTADIKNPFADTSGISGQFKAPTTANAPSSTTGGGTTNQPANQATTQKNPTQRQQQTMTGKNVQSSQTVNPLQPQIDTRARLQEREERIRLNMDPGPESTAYSIDDLLPVGVVSGGDGKDEVMFYSEAACRVVSFPVGTRFYDGWFDSTRQEGVVFGFFDQYRTMRMRAWGRSVKEGCSQSLLEQTSPDQALTTGGGD